MRKYLLLQIPFLWVVLTSYSQHPIRSIGGVPVQHHFTTEDYQGGIQNWDLALSQSGLIYAANNSGLLEFDGNKWVTYNFASNTRMICVNTTDPNRIYVGGQNVMGYFEHDDKGILNYHSIIDLIEDTLVSVDVVWSIIHHEEKYFFNTDRYTFTFDDQKVTAIPFQVDGGYLFKVGDSLISYSRSEGLLGWDGKKFQSSKTGSFFKEKSVMSILANSNGDWKVFLSNGDIYTIIESKISLWKNDANEFLNNVLINTAIQRKNGTIAIGTQNDGILILDNQGNLINHFTKGRGLNGRSVHGILEDDFNNLWIGQNNGISYLEMGAPFRFINENLGLWGTGYAAARHKGKLYLGTNNGLFSTQSSGNSLIDEYELVPGTEGQVWSIETHQDRLLMGHHRGAFSIRNNKANILFNQNGVWRFNTIPNTDKLIAGWYNGFLSADDLTHFTPIEGLNESSRVFEFENDSTLWMTHGFKGTYRVTISPENTLKYDFYGKNQGFPSNILINVFKLGNELVFPAEYGIYQYDQNKDLFVPSQQLEELLGHNTHVSAMEMSPNGDIYYIVDKKFGLLKRTAFNAYENIQNPFNGIAKYLSDDLENITYIDEQNVLIGAKEGFVNYNPSLSTGITRDFKTYLRSLRLVLEKDSIVNFGHFNSSDNLGNIPFPLTSIRFEYASPYLDGFKDIRFQYKLDNFDKDWSDWSVTHFKEYTNLPFGRYTFRVRAKNIYDEISTEAELSFRIIAPWYRTNYAYAGYIIFLFMAFGLAMFSLDRKHKDDKRLMEITQKREMHQKNLELKDVSQSSAATISALKNEKLQAEINHKNKELASSAMHILNKNEFMGGLKSKLSTLAKNDNITTDEIRRIIRNIDKNIAEDKDWDQFTAHFDQVHGDFLSHLKEQYPELTPQETKLAAYLRMNMSSKEIAQLLNISVRGVEIGRYRLRKKLRLDRETNLVTFMMDL